MRIAQIHNKYKDVGGEDIVVRREKDLLEEAGYEVIQFFASNTEIKSTVQKAKTALTMPYNLTFKNRVSRFLEKHTPDIVHVHNFLPLLSPAIFFACKEKKIPVVLTLHNFRLLCLNGLLYRDEHLCEDCISKKFAAPGIRHGCYQDSSIASLFPAITNSLHTALDTWYDKIDKVVFLSAFSKAIFDKSHLNFTEEQAVIKPNFIADNGYALEKEDYYLFVGRLSEEKGIRTVIGAFEGTDRELVVVGDGPLRGEVDAASLRSSNIRCVGFQSSEQLKTRYSKAQATIFASKMYEGLGLVNIESFSYGTPVIAPDFGNAGELVISGINGVKYQQGSVTSLKEALATFENLSNRNALNKGARSTFENEFTAVQNLKQLEAIYASVITNGA